jgi:uncharacterized protein YndB with AHSA1/START domain
MSPKPESDSRSFEVKIEIDAPVEAVWKAIAEGEEIAKWFAPEVRVEPGVGGSIYCSWGPGMEGTMKIAAWEPNQHLGIAEYRDKPYGCSATDAPAAGDGVTRRISTDYFIEAKEGGGTVLRLVQSGFGASADWDAEIESLSRGWPTFFRVMKHGIEKHPGEPARNITIMATSKRNVDEVWSRLMGPGGLRDNSELEYGDILIDGHRHFAAVISNWNNALCSLVGEGSPEKTGATVYWMLTLYSTPSERVEALQTRWTDELQRLM